MKLLRGNTNAGIRGEAVELVPSVSRADWRKLCDRHPDSTVFHSHDFLEAVSGSLRCELHSLGVVWRDDIVGVAPVLLKRLGPFSTINWIPFPYLGPLVPRPLVGATLDALVGFAKTRRCLNHQQSFAVEHCPYDGRFEHRSDRTFVIDVRRTDEELRRAMHRKVRLQVRRAEDFGFEVAASTPEDLQLMEEWASGLFSARGMTWPYGLGVCGAVSSALGKSRYSLFESARYEGRLVAASIFLATRTTAFGWQIAVDPAFKARYPQALLIWRAAQWARGLELAQLDLVGAPTNGIAEYKSRWGAEERRFSVMRMQARTYRLAAASFRRVLVAKSAGVRKVANAPQSNSGPR